jgi:hypothetical protein
MEGERRQNPVQASRYNEQEMWDKGPFWDQSILDYTVLQPRKTKSEQSTLWKSQNSPL